MAQTRTAPKAAQQETPPAASTDNLPAARPRNNGVNAIVPQSWQEITAIAGAICRAKMAPKSYCDQQGNPYPDKVAVAIMHGMEVGMTPMASLQSIAVINGMPSLYGDGMLAVVRASGYLEDIVEEEEDWDKNGPVAAICKVKRKGEATWGVQRVCRDDAIKAGWWDKAGPWKLTPHRMLQMRARGWALRDKFADVLRGLHSAEEMLDMVDVTPQGAATTTPAEAEPRREDFDKKPNAPAADAPKQEVQEPPKTTADTGPKTNKREAAKKTATDVRDENDPGPQQEPAGEEPDDPSAKQPGNKGDAEPLKFEEYTRIGDFFIFADPWIADPKRTEAELIAFSTFYHKFIQERLSPDFKNERVRDAMKDTMRVYQECLALAQKKK